jgi:hypothetical protein
MPIDEVAGADVLGDRGDEPDLLDRPGERALLRSRMAAVVSGIGRQGARVEVGVSDDAAAPPDRGRRSPATVGMPPQMGAGRAGGLVDR